MPFTPEQHREHKKRVRAKGLCGVCHKRRPAGNWYKCRPCYDKEQMRQMSTDQDLSAYPNFARGERNGLRFASTWLPKPSWSKHTRTALTARAGFRPLTKAAKQYEQFLVQAVLVNELNGWIREGTEYILEVISFVHKSDMDQWSGGILDGLVKAGLMADDKHGEALVSRRRLIPKDQEQRIFIAVYETEKGQVQ